MRSRESSPPPIKAPKKTGEPVNSSSTFSAEAGTASWEGGLPVWPPFDPRHPPFEVRRRPPPAKSSRSALEGIIKPLDRDHAPLRLATHHRPSPRGILGLARSERRPLASRIAQAKRAAHQQGSPTGRCTHFLSMDACMFVGGVTRRSAECCQPDLTRRIDRQAGCSAETGDTGFASHPAHHDPCYAAINASEC